MPRSLAVSPKRKEELSHLPSTIRLPPEQLWDRHRNPTGLGTSSGETLRSVCADLNERGVPTVTGVQWSSTVLRRILVSGAVSGQVEHLGEIVAAGDWPPILTPTDTTRLRRKLLDPSRRTNRAPRRYPLSGLVLCGLCGTKMVARPREDGARRYFCAKGPGFKGCNRMAILAETLEEFVAEAVLFRLDTPDLQRTLLHVAAEDDEADLLQTEIDEAQELLDALAAAHGNGDISLREWLLARKPAEARKEEASRRIGHLSGSSAIEGFVGHGINLRSQWTELDPARQGAIVAALIDHLTINSALKGRNFFDPSRVGVSWRISG